MSAAIREPASYLEIWRDVLAHVLGEIASTPVSCVLEKESPADLPAPSEGDLWILVSALGSLRGEMGIRVPGASVVHLAQFFTGEPAAADTAITSDHRDAVLELLRQTSGLVVTGAKTNWGEIQLHLDFTPAAPSWPSSYIAWLRLDRPAEVILELHCSVALTAALDSEPAESSQPAPVPPLVAPAQGPPSEEPSPVPIELLRDVELAVTLRFGSRGLLLREVLDLSPGSVIELDREVQEPVDLLLDGRVIARGEVVVVEGNYGLRVTEVAPPGA